MQNARTMSQSGMNAIEVVGLTCQFGAVRAVDGLSVCVPVGSVFGIIGPNGAGKTTLMRCALGLILPSSGTVRILGQDHISHNSDLRKRIGILLEHTGLYERLTASANLEFYGRLYGMDLSSRRERVKEMLQGAELWDRQNDLVGTFSKGMKQQLALARALLHKPELVLLDEPTSGLDPLAAFAFRARLTDYAQEHNRTVVIATHLLHEAEALCDIVAIVRAGRIVTVASPAQLRSTAGNPRLMISAEGITPESLSALRSQPWINSAGIIDGSLEVELKKDANAADVISILVSQGVSVEAVQRNDASFEAACLALLGAA
jgi:ABC-2 type transport system ATP-binding protein